MNVRSCFVLIIITLFVGGCTKDVQKSRTEILTANEWQLIEIETRTYGQTPGPWKSLFQTWRTCYNDNKRIFLKDYRYETNEGATRCSSTDPQVIENGVWEFNADETIVLIHLQTGPNFGVTIDFNIELIEENRLQLTKAGIDIRGNPEQARFTYAK